MLVFRAYGIPRPQGSKRYVGNGRFVEASNVKPWRIAVANAAFKALAEAGLPEFTEPVVIRATFYLPRPKTVKRIWPSVPPDVDKLCRALGDGISVDAQGVLADDSLIVRWDATKVYVADESQAGAQVSIRLATDNDLEHATSVFTDSL